MPGPCGLRETGLGGKINWYSRESVSRRVILLAPPLPRCHRIRKRQSEGGSSDLDRGQSGVVTKVQPVALFIHSFWACGKRCPSLFFLREKAVKHERGKSEPSKRLLRASAKFFFFPPRKFSPTVLRGEKGNSGLQKLP